MRRAHRQPSTRRRSRLCSSPGSTSPSSAARELPSCSGRSGSLSWPPRALGLALKDARAEAGPRHRPGRDAARRRRRTRPSTRRPSRGSTSHTRPGEPMLLAPQLTALYTLSGRQDPLPQISLLPGALPTTQAQRDAIATLESEPRSARDHRSPPLHRVRAGTFGVTFDRTLAAWIDRHFSHVATLADARDADARRLAQEEGLMKRVGITGAAGFIGSHLCDRLLAEGVEVVGVDDLSHGSLANLEYALGNPRFRFEQFDCTNRRELRATFDGCDAIVHLAAQKIPRYGGALMTLEANVAGVNAAAQRGADARRRPRRRVDLRRLRQRAGPVRGGRQPRARPADDSSLGLRGLEALRRARLPRSGRGARTEGHDPAPLRLVRPAQPSELVGRPAGGVHRDPARRRDDRDPRRRPQVRTFTYVTDTVDGFVRALRTPEARGEVINIGGSQPTDDSRSGRSWSRRPSALPLPLRAKFVPYESLPGKLPGRPLTASRIRPRHASCSASRQESRSRRASSTRRSGTRERRQIEGGTPGG